MYGGSAVISSAIELGMTLYLNGIRTDILLNTTYPAGGVSLMYHADNMEDEDHQFSGRLMVLRGFPVIDYFECVVPLFHFVPRTVCH